MSQFSKVLLAIDKAHTVLQRAVLSIWQVPSPGLTKTNLGIAILLNS